MTAGDTSAAIRHLDKLYEFDREPVSKGRLLGPGHFAGSFAGEHVAATEFVIGALFVTWGASIKDIFLGLAVGNLLAVLTWTSICAPIAVETRLTLYWYLRRIGGPFMTVIYNVCNAVLFCILAGCMITVSASAVRIPFGIPPQTGWFPTDPRFVLVVLSVGAVVVTLAILGFKKLAAFASVCSPWMFLMFVAGAVVMVPKLAAEAGFGAIRSFDEFWQTGEKVVWTGRLPPGSELSEPMGFWKVAAFAWICNLAMHAGLSDMALFRFAKRASYGLCSAFGMFLGHYLAWICAGMMGAGAALLMEQPLSELDAGAVGYQALGWAGAMAVIIAGWTTSNPTLYRAGLALQAVTPNWSRAKVTFVAGAVTTIIACSPFVFTKLLDFVGVYGLLLVPAGAIVLAEHWIFPKIGLTRYWASRGNISLNWPALISWATAIAFALGLWLTDVLHLFYLFLPVYVFTSLVYIVLASLSGAREPAPAAAGEAEAAKAAETARSSDSARGRASSAIVWSSGLVALAALVACLLLPIQVFLDGSERFASNLEWVRTWMVLPTLLYFVAGTIFYLELQKTRTVN